MRNWTQVLDARQDEAETAAVVQGDTDAFALEAGDVDDRSARFVGLNDGPVGHNLVDDK